MNIENPVVSFLLYLTHTIISITACYKKITDRKRKSRIGLQRFLLRKRQEYNTMNILASVHKNLYDPNLSKEEYAPDSNPDLYCKKSHNGIILQGIA